MTIIYRNTKGWQRSCIGRDGQDYVEFEVPGQVLVQFKCTEIVKEKEVTFGEFCAVVFLTGDSGL